MMLVKYPNFGQFLKLVHHSDNTKIAGKNTYKSRITLMTIYKHTFHIHKTQWISSNPGYDKNPLHGSHVLYSI